MKLGVCAHITYCARNADGRQSKRHPNAVASWSKLFLSRRCYHQDERNRCSAFWVPSFNVHGKREVKDEKEDSNILLMRAGFVRQAYSGIFHLLPLGLRVQAKIEQLLDKHMRGLRASKISCSSFSSQNLWSTTGRLAESADVFKFSDRKDAKWLLSPTHEEEITKLVGGIVQSYRDLPVRLYQISRKYRDEPRPRQGLLRGREFLMKDLYTFDVDAHVALQTYNEVRATYGKFFQELKMPYVVTKADSGNMGGRLSHEYHLPSPKGEDSIISCTHCDYVRNEELVESKEVTVRPLGATELDVGKASERDAPLKEAMFITRDRQTLIKVYRKIQGETAFTEDSNNEINPHAVKAAVPEVALGVENPAEQFRLSNPRGGSIWYMFDDQVTQPDIQARLSADRGLRDRDNMTMSIVESAYGSPGIPDLAKLQNGERCPVCAKGQVQVQKAIEIGHTFHLGTRYSEALDVKVAVDPGSKSQHESFVQMGCHGIGVSRLIAAVASTLSDNTGLNWPRVLAPFEVVIIPHRPNDIEACVAIYDQILQDEPACNDAIVDDRQIDWLSKLRDADLIGYPVIIFLGKAWRERGEYEVQCRRLKVKQNSPGTELSTTVKNLLKQL